MDGTRTQLMAEARTWAEEYDRKLLATDKRFRGAVYVVTEEGASHIYLSAFVVKRGQFYIVFTEHEGIRYHDYEGVYLIRAYQPGKIERA